MIHKKASVGYFSEPFFRKEIVWEKMILKLFPERITYNSSLDM